MHDKVYGDQERIFRRVIAFSSFSILQLEIETDVVMCRFETRRSLISLFLFNVKFSVRMSNVNTTMTDE